METNELNNAMAQLMKWRPLISGGYLWNDDYFSPTERGNHFGVVLEWLIEQKPYLSLCLEQGLNDKAYLCIFTTGSGYKQVTVEQWGDGPLEAACRAILEAWGDGHRDAPLPEWAADVEGFTQGVDR